MTTQTLDAMELCLRPSDTGTDEVTGNLNRLLADMFALYVKTKNFHWHVSGPHFRDYHLLLDDQAAQILATTDIIAERVRKLGRGTIRSIGHISHLQQIADNDSADIAAKDMLNELQRDNTVVVNCLRGVHEVCDRNGDVATASLIENWIDEAEQRIWFLSETSK
jgi:starvation-inducible DNA-binding protein